MLPVEKSNPKEPSLLTKRQRRKTILRWRYNQIQSVYEATLRLLLFCLLR